MPRIGVRFTEVHQGPKAWTLIVILMIPRGVAFSEKHLHEVSSNLFVCCCNAIGLELRPVSNPENVMQLLQSQS